MALATAALVGCSSVPGITAASQDMKPFEEVIRSGLIAEKNAFVPDPPICPGPVPQDVRDRLIAQLPMRLATYFAEPQLGKEISIATAVLQHGPSCLYGGGVDWVRLNNLRTNGTTATVAGQVRAWEKLAQWQGRHVYAEPHNTIDCSFQLTKVDGRWRITHYRWTFAPGSEP
jgi:hypothetical protein